MLLCVHIVLLVVLPCLYGFRFSVFHLNDLHGFVNGDPTGRGGFARLRSIVKELEGREPHLLKFHGGDAISGTLYTALSSSRLFPELSVEYQFLRLIGMDGTVFGNHEHDCDEDDLLSILKTAQKHDGIIPQKSTKPLPILATNIRVNVDCEAWIQLFNETENPIIHFKDFMVKEIRKGDEILRVGVLGLQSPNSVSVTSHTRSCLTYLGYTDSDDSENMDDVIELITEKSTMLRNRYGVHVVVLVNHSGGTEEAEILKRLEKKSKKLGQRLIDIHLSGHVHEGYSFRHPSGVIVLLNLPHADQAGLLQLNYDFASQRLDWLNENVEGSDITMWQLRNQELLPSLINAGPDITPEAEYIEAIHTMDTLINQFLLKNVPFEMNSIVIDGSQFPFTRYKNKKREFVRDITTIIHDEIDREIKLKGLGSTGLDWMSISTAQTRVELEHLEKFTNQTQVRFQDLFVWLGTGWIGSKVNSDILPGDSIVLLWTVEKELRFITASTILYARFVNELFEPSFGRTFKFSERWWGIPFYNRLTNIQILKDGKTDILKERKYIRYAISDLAYQYLRKTKTLTRGLYEHPIRDRFGRKVKHPLETNWKPYIFLARAFQRWQDKSQHQWLKLESPEVWNIFNEESLPSETRFSL